MLALGLHDTMGRSAGQPFQVRNFRLAGADRRHLYFLRRPRGFSSHRPHLITSSGRPPVVVGYDTRFLSGRFAEIAPETLLPEVKNGSGKLAQDPEKLDSQKSLALTAPTGLR